MYGDWEWWNSRVMANIADYGHKFNVGVYNIDGELLEEEALVWNDLHRREYTSGEDFPLQNVELRASDEPMGDLGWTTEQRMSMRDSDYNIDADSSPPTSRREQR